MESIKSKEMLKTEILQDSTNINILCSVYDKVLTSSKISSLLNLETNDVSKRLEQLNQFGIISKRTLNNEEYFFFNGTQNL